MNTQPTNDRISLAAFHAGQAKELMAFARLMRDCRQDGEALRSIALADQHAAKAEHAMREIVR